MSDLVRMVDLRSALHDKAKGLTVPAFTQREFWALYDYLRNPRGKCYTCGASRDTAAYGIDGEPYCGRCVGY